MKWKKKIIKKHKNLSSELWLIFFHPSRMFLHELPELVQVPIPSVFLRLQLEIGMNGQQIFTLTLIVDLPSCTYCETIGVVRVAEFNIFIKTSVNLTSTLFPIMKTCKKQNNSRIPVCTVQTRSDCSQFTYVRDFCFWSALIL